MRIPITQLFMKGNIPMSLFKTLHARISQALGQVEANINGDNVIIAGKVKGNVSVTKMLTLLPTAILTGDINAPKLNIVEGAVFQGGCHMSVPEVHDWMGPKELATYLELEESSIMELVNSGKIPVVREGDRLRFERVQIDAWAASGMVK